MIPKLCSRLRIWRDHRLFANRLYDAKKPIGPKIVPCGTPALTVVNLDITQPILTRCIHWHKQYVSQLVIKCSNPSDANLVSKIWWSTRSNAFLKSTSSTRIMVPLDSSAAFHMCTSSIRACTVDVPLTDPNCWGLTWSPAMAVIQVQVKCSKHFDNTGVSEIGRRSLWMSAFP